MKKNLLKIAGVIALLFLCVALSLGAAPAIVGLKCVAPIVLPTQQIVFMRSLQEEYKQLDTWLIEAQDLSSFVAEGQTLRFPEAGAWPDVYVNQTTDVDAVEPTETAYDVALDYYDSQNYKLRNINMHALPYDKMAFYTNRSALAIKIQEVKDAAYNYAPDVADTKKIIIPTTGPTRSGFKMATLTDIITLARACDNAGFPPNGRNLVLPSDMWWDLVVNNTILNAQLGYQINNGILNPSIVNYYGFKIHKSFMENAQVAYDISASAKAAQGAIISGNVVPAGFVFVNTEVYRAGGAFNMFLLSKAQNPTGRADEFGFSHRFKADFVLNAKRYSAMLYQALAV
jgi:hypothetical protein